MSSICGTAIEFQFDRLELTVDDAGNCAERLDGGPIPKIGRELEFMGGQGKKTPTRIVDHIVSIDILCDLNWQQRYREGCSAQHPFDSIGEMISVGIRLRSLSASAVFEGKTLCAQAT